jgi:pheromone shutdown-related protein TraB
METIGNITIIGTSHISKDSILEIERFITDKKPDIVAAELDNARLAQLYSPEQKLSFRGIFQIGFNGFLFAVIGKYVQKKLGEIVGIKPGSDMKTAIELAKKNNIELALIDQHIAVTLRRFSKYFTWKEKLQIVRDLFSAPFKKNPLLNFDLSKVPSKQIIKILLSEVKNKYPNIYHVLVEERNEVMASNLRKLSAANPGKKILAVVGAGHEEGMLELLRKDIPFYSYSFSVSV